MEISLNPGRLVGAFNAGFAGVVPDRGRDLVVGDLPGLETAEVRAGELSAEDIVSEAGPGEGEAGSPT